MKNPVKVIEIKERPAQSEPPKMIMNGIRTKAEAEQWGAKYGFSLVKWLKSKERAYGMQTIADDAQALEHKSATLLACAEKGQGLLEMMVCTAIVFIVLFYVLPKLRPDWKW
jgi:hypothetical protein